MTAQIHLRTALRDQFGPAARAQGYRGSAPTWRKVSEADYVAVVNVQTSSSSTASRVMCVLNISVVPEPYLRWQAARGYPVDPRKVANGMGPYFDRYEPSSPGAIRADWWDVYDDASASTAVQDMLQQMADGGWCRLDSVITPEGMLASVRKGDLGFGSPRSPGGPLWKARSLLLMDAGPSDELDEALDGFLHDAGPHREHRERFVSWVREQAHRAERLR